MSLDAYLKIDEIPGEALSERHQDWIELLDFHYGIAQAVSSTASSAGGATAGGADCPDIRISKYLDKASPKLFESCACGKHFKKMIIHINRAGGKQQQYLEIKLEEVLISSVSGGGSGDFPIEGVALNYGRISFKYTQQKRSDGLGGGVINGGWDRVAQKTFA